MTMDPMIQVLQQLVEMDDRLLSFGNQGQWDQLAPLCGERDELLQSLLSRKLLSTQGELLQACLEHMAETNQKLIALGEQEMSLLAGELRQIRTGQKLGHTYGD